MIPDRPLLGIALMIGFTATAPVMDAFAKLASPEIPVGQIVAFRFGIQTLILLPLALALRSMQRPSLRDLGLHFARAALILLATSAFFAALATMPMADAMAILFVMPFILTLLGALMLKETIGWRRILACAVGFLGALLVIRPSFGIFGMVALLPLFTALCFAFYMILTRGMAPRLHPVALQAWTALAAFVLILPLMVLANGSGIAVLDPVWPQGRFWTFLVAVGVMASVSHLLLSAALRFAPAASVAPLQYLEIVAATTLGYWVFGDFPDPQTLAGIAIIVASGLFVIMRERHLNRRPPPPA